MLENHLGHDQGWRRRIANHHHDHCVLYQTHLSWQFASNINHVRFDLSGEKLYYNRLNEIMNIQNSNFYRSFPHIYFFAIPGKCNDHRSPLSKPKFILVVWFHFLDGCKDNALCELHHHHFIKKWNLAISDWKGHLVQYGVGWGGDYNYSSWIFD